MLVSALFPRDLEYIFFEIVSPHGLKLAVFLPLPPRSWGLSLFSVRNDTNRSVGQVAPYTRSQT